MKFLHPVKALDPVADALAGTVYSDVINMKNIIRGAFVLHKGVGATGVSTITIEACDDVTPSNTSAIAFEYQKNTTGDTYGAVGKATADGVALTAGSSQANVFYVDAARLAKSGYGYVRLKAVESTDSAVLAGILFIPLEVRDDQEIPESRIV